MNESRVHIMAIDSPSGLCNSIEEIKKAADAIKISIKRFCIKEKLNCLAVIAGSICDKGGAKRGRYGSYLLPNVEEKPAHIHITMVIDKSRTSSRRIKELLSDSFGAKFNCKPVKTLDHLKNRLPYSFGQRWCHRTVTACTEEFVARYCGDFIRLSEKLNRATGDGKPVFRQYANLKLRTDRVIYDFRRSRKPQNSMGKTTEVLTKTTTNAKDLFAFKFRKSEPVFCNNREKQTYFDAFLPKSQFSDDACLNSSVKYNKYSYNLCKVANQSIGDTYLNPF